MLRLRSRLTLPFLVFARAPVPWLAQTQSREKLLMGCELLLVWVRARGESRVHQDVKLAGSLHVHFHGKCPGSESIYSVIAEHGSYPLARLASIIKYLTSLIGKIAVTAASWILTWD